MRTNHILSTKNNSDLLLNIHHILFNHSIVSLIFTYIRIDYLFSVLTILKGMVVGLELSQTTFHF